MTTLRDLFGDGELDDAITAGFVRVQHHPTLPYSIFNYSETCAYARAWTPVTTACRGLISRSSDGEVLARGFDKFWNHNEPESAGIIEAGGPVTVTAKEDGSLGVLYPVNDTEFAVATRGSFGSEQALHATQIWRDLYAGRWAPPVGMTALFEIVYPANRIVLDYGGLDDLILLGFVETATVDRSDPMAWRTAGRRGRPRRCRTPRSLRRSPMSLAKASRDTSCTSLTRTGASRSRAPGTRPSTRS